LQEETRNLDLNEMDQVAGGGSTRGTALSACFGVGIGAGITVKINDERKGSYGHTYCRQ